MKAKYKMIGKCYVHKGIAEKTLGRKLKYGECVHHIDYNTFNNSNNNLVICPNEEYHKLLHIRTDALNITGDANKRRCTYCKKYDDVDNMTKITNRPIYYHKECSNDRSTIRRAK
jgi:hypothetical protein